MDFVLVSLDAYGEPALRRAHLSASGRWHTWGDAHRAGRRQVVRALPLAHAPLTRGVPDDFRVPVALRQPPEHHCHAPGFFGLGAAGYFGRSGQGCGRPRWSGRFGRCGPVGCSFHQGTLKPYKAFLTDLAHAWEKSPLKNRSRPTSSGAGFITSFWQRVPAKVHFSAAIPSGTAERRVIP